MPILGHVAKNTQYPGPNEALARYESLVARHPEAERRGAKNPYTSVNGWMTSFLDPGGRLHLRMGDDARAAVTADGGVPTKQYGKNMPEFVGVTEDAFADATRADELFASSWEWSASKPPK